jgi:hypothetical protein
MFNGGHMKKILIPAAAIILLLQGLYILKLRHDLDVRRKIDEQTILEVLNRAFDRTFEYTKNEVQTTYELPEPLDEPDCLDDHSEIVKRIEMLEMHLDYNPSKKWIKDVLHEAKEQLK